MNKDALITIILLGGGFIFSEIWGGILFKDVATYMDGIGNPALSIIVLNLPSILLVEGVSFLIWIALGDMGAYYSKSILNGIGLWFGYMYLDYWEPPASVLPSGEIVKTTLGWSGTSDVFMASILQWAGLPTDKLYFYTYVYGPIIFLIIAFALGGVPLLVQLFAGEEAAEAVEEEG